MKNKFMRKLYFTRYAFYTRSILSGCHDFVQKRTKVCLKANAFTDNIIGISQTLYAN